MAFPPGKDDVSQPVVTTRALRKATSRQKGHTPSGAPTGLHIPVTHRQRVWPPRLSVETNTDAFIRCPSQKDTVQAQHHLASSPATDLPAEPANGPEYPSGRERCLLPSLIRHLLLGNLPIRPSCSWQQHHAHVRRSPSQSGRAVQSRELSTA